MAVKPILPDEFLARAKTAVVFDVRSDSEYKQAHIPGALHLPLFNDEERKVVGTAYKQESREKAIKIGLDFFGPKMRAMVETVEHLVKDQADKKDRPAVLLYCWRGGMRSAGVAWLMDLYGFTVYTLRGGYKSFRRTVLESFNLPYHFKMIGGYTGSGKTDLLKRLRAAGKAVIDLEDLANHRGSALGAMKDKPQPRQEMFENLLFFHLTAIGELPSGNEIYIEDESQRIGNLQIPQAIWKQLRKAPVYFLDVPFEERLQYLTEHYGKQDKEQLINAVLRIQKRLGGLETKTTLKFLQEGNNKEAFRMLLCYYDKCYKKALAARADGSASIQMITSTGTDAALNHELFAAAIK